MDHEINPADSGNVPLDTSDYSSLTDTPTYRRRKRNLIFIYKLRGFICHKPASLAETQSAMTEVFYGTSEDNEAFRTWTMIIGFKSWIQVIGRKHLIQWLHFTSHGSDPEL